MAISTNWWYSPVEEVSTTQKKALEKCLHPMSDPSQICGHRPDIWLPILMVSESIIYGPSCRHHCWKFIHEELNTWTNVNLHIQFSNSLSVCTIQDFSSLTREAPWKDAPQIPANITDTSYSWLLWGRLAVPGLQVPVRNHHSGFGWVIRLGSRGSQRNTHTIRAGSALQAAWTKKQQNNPRSCLLGMLLLFTRARRFLVFLRQ